MSGSNKFSRVFQVFQSQEAYFKEIKEGNAGWLIISQLIIVCLFTFIYGLSMGSYSGIQQALVAGMKLATLFVSTLAICFPSFYIIQLILGSRIKLQEVISIVLGGFVLSSTVMLAFLPVIVFFLATGNNYYFLQLLHIATFIFSGYFGVRLIIESLKYSCEEEEIYPKIGVSVFKIWALIFAFVGVQLAWNLRPFLGDRDQPFTLFRDYQGNFYTAVIYSFRQLNDADEQFESVPIKSEEEQQEELNHAFKQVPEVSDTLK